MLHSEVTTLELWVLSTRATHETYRAMLLSTESLHVLFLSTSVFFQFMWLPQRTELTQCLTVHKVLTIFPLVAPLSSPWSSVLSCSMSNDPGSMCVSACMLHLGGVVPHVIPPLPLSKMCLKCPHLPSNPQHHISVNPLHPHVLTPDCFTSWLTPYGVVKNELRNHTFPSGNNHL